MDNIRIRRARFLNQNSLFGLDLEKVFFAAEPKIVLQQNRPGTDSRTATAKQTIRRTSSSRHLSFYEQSRRVISAATAFEMYRLCCKSWPVSRRPSAIGNNRIRKRGFVNQYSPFGLVLERLFLAPGPKIFLQ